MIKKYVELLQRHGYGLSHAHRVIVWLLQKVKGLTSVELLTQSIVLTEKEEQQVVALIGELIFDNKPLQYILGTAPFCGLDILVEPPILIPRPETEEWVSGLIDLLKKETSLNILDLCSGSGCISFALAHHLPHSHVIGSDISWSAISLAQKNKINLGIESVSFIQSDLYENLEKERFDVIVSNPPYIAENEWLSLEPHVKNWEDKVALVADNNGLALIEKIIERAPYYFRKGPLSLLVVEIGYSQAEAVCTFMRSCGYTEVNVQKDLAGIDRVVVGRYVAKEK